MYKVCESFLKKNERHRNGESTRYGVLRLHRCIEVTDISGDWFCILAIAAGWNHFRFLNFRSKRCLEKRINGFLSFSFLLLMLMLSLVSGYCHDCQYRINGISKCFSIHGNLLLEITSKCCHFLLLYISEKGPFFLIKILYKYIF